MRAAIGLVAACVALGSCTAGLPAKANTAHGDCVAADLVLRHGSITGAATGEHGDIYTVTNSGDTTCVLMGYPTVVLQDAAGAAMPFHYSHESPYVTAAAPRDVTLGPGRSAYFKVAKYRCDLGSDTIAATTDVMLPGQQDTTLRISTSGVAPNAPGGGVSALEHCTPGADDPGNTISVSPFVGTAEQTSG